jgi:hypothetical protein
MFICILYTEATLQVSRVAVIVERYPKTTAIPKSSGENNMHKQVIAFLSAFIITAIVALSMLVVGVNAASNPNGVAASNSPTTASAAASVSTTTGSSQAQVAQLQSLVAQYQARDQQYQAALASDNQQLAQASQEMQMIQQLLLYLQNHGLIQINSQGQITVLGN